MVHEERLMIIRGLIIVLIISIPTLILLGHVGIVETLLATIIIWLTSRWKIE